MELIAARTRALHLCDALAPWCERIIVAGSIRRLKPQVKDIELVCIPRPGHNLFGEPEGHCEGFAMKLAEYRIKKGDAKGGRYIQLLLADDTAVDLFTTTHDNWGWILTLRTGSSEHNIKMVQRLKANGYVCTNGRVHWKGEPLELREEQEVFRRAGLPFIEPQFRTVAPSA